MKTLSIIVPHYNSVALLPTLLNSIPDEPWLDIIVVDDHSDKSSYKSLQKLLLGYENCRCFRVAEGKKGPGVARNIGVENSCSDWVLFADSDDYFSESAFSYIKQYLESEFDVVYFAPDSINTQTHQQGLRHKQYADLVSRYIKAPNNNIFLKFFSPCSKLISKAVIENYSVKFDDGVGGEDNNFSLKLAYYSKNVAADNNVIYMITESDESLTRHFSEIVLENHFFALSRYNDFLREKNMSSYQVPMLGWVLKARKISYLKMLNWLFVCIKKRYPVSPHHYLKF